MTPELPTTEPPWGWWTPNDDRVVELDEEPPLDDTPQVVSHRAGPTDEGPARST